VVDVPRGNVRRLLDDELVEALRLHPAVLVVGPRASGRTTTARQYAASIVRLDRPAEAAAFQADADAALATLAEPVLLDEWQTVPELLGAVERAVDEHADRGAGLALPMMVGELPSVCFGIRVGRSADVLGGSAWCGAACKTRGVWGTATPNVVVGRMCRPVSSRSC
jgi:hypothetical protein